MRIVEHGRPFLREQPRPAGARRQVELGIADDRMAVVLEQFGLREPVANLLARQQHQVELAAGLVEPDRAVTGPVAGGIGRASCRARVCQYVYLSVVAVSLKKKKKN